MNGRSLIAWLRLLGLIEGASFLLLLFVAMPLKHLAGEPLAVRIFGIAHGALFMAYVLVLFRVWIGHEWPIKRVAGFFFAGLLPFGPFIVDKRLRQFDETGANL